jgi:DNA-binding NarL/FixJ family response regulator
MKKPVSIVLADDHAIVREGIASICQTQGEFQVVGQCADGAAAVEMIDRLRPDVAIVDLNMPKLHGLEVIRKVRASNTRVKMAVLSISRDQKTVMQALHAGANAFLLKDGPSRHLLEAIVHIMDGGLYISPLIEATQLFSPRGRTRNADPVESLSSREYEVFSLLVEGFRAKEIAERLDISPKTVDTYRASLMRKLDIHDLAGLVKFAIQRNLTTVGHGGEQPGAPAPVNFD